MPYPSSPLYCYFSIEKGLEFLKTLKFRLYPICAFNDPFESLFITQYPHYFLSLTNLCTDEEMENRIKELDSKCMAMFKSRVRNKSIGRLNIIRKLRVGCFSENCNSILMWGHYARQFTGIVIKFRVSFGDWGNNLHRVQYSNKRLKISKFHENELIGNNKEYELIINKSNQWEYEKEWRYINATSECEEDEKGNYISLDKDAILGVMVGYRIDMQKLDELKSIIASDFYNIPIKVALPSKEDYSLDFQDLEEIEYALKWR